MKIIITLLVLFSLVCNTKAQSVHSAINSGAVSNNNMIFSVGEIFVNPVGSQDQANSGLIGAISRIKFFVGVDKILYSEDLKVYPNPTYNAVFFDLDGRTPIEQVFIYDTQGKLVSTQNLSSTNAVDLSELNDGLYLIQTNVKNIKAIKIIKQSL